MASGGRTRTPTPVGPTSATFAWSLLDFFFEEEEEEEEQEEEVEVVVLVSVQLLFLIYDSFFTASLLFDCGSHVKRVMTWVMVQRGSVLLVSGLP